MKLADNQVSRRRLLRGAGTAAGAGLLGAAAGQMGSSPRALALIGDRYHNPDYIRVSLDRVFKEVGIPVDYTIQYDGLSRDLLRKYQLFVVLRDGMIWPNGYLGPDAYTAYAQALENRRDFPEARPVSWMTEEQGAAVKDFVTAGGAFYAMHNSSHISLSSKNYREVMGGAYIGHPPLRPFKVRAVNKQHPITRGLGEFIVNDEQHYVAYDKDRKYVLLESENIDGLDYDNHGTKAIGGWAYEYGKGRVVFTAVGHTNHALWNPVHLELVKRSVQWALRRI